MEIVVPWIIFSVLVGLLTRSKGRGFALGFFVSLLLSPLVGLIWALVAGKSHAARAAELEAEERMRRAVRAKLDAEEAAPASGRGWEPRPRNERPDAGNLRRQGERDSGA
ncbi:hypothetical protein LNKW23_04220 [Paralimibaculum aggregatum]|uniref:YqaE/Pmp3 family membrane protein n=1 Tax=Paralimibaculum aggregatum TaxID=3036245 RepID=A0ABQ6LCW3_9RHOB|nr:hypothetical protein [Limibaculum sp. NKW23]GMG81210.1 hypothetical protein LNKW23_04220 [Limibaculum sp. NKW23]